LNIAIQTLFFMLMLVPKKSQKNVELWSTFDLAPR
jgi:hypothetical protein